MRHQGSLVKKINAAQGVSNHLVFNDVSSIGAKVQIIQCLLPSVPQKSSNFVA